MKEVLETYAIAYDPQHPVLCLDEHPVQLLKETRTSIAATKDHGKRVDYEYERNGTASIFMFAEQLSGFRQTTARKRRTKVDWAVEVAGLLWHERTSRRLTSSSRRSMAAGSTSRSAN